MTATVESGGDTQDGVALAAGTAVPLAEAKLSAPRQRQGIVPRRAVLRALDASAEARLTLVAAPPGYGKTTAVREWCASRNASLAWVTLDTGDDDPSRMWRYIATAVDRVRPGLGRRALRRLNAPAEPIEGPVDELLNRVAAFEGELVLVLDDVQAVTDPECMASLDYALDHLPANAHVIMLTRIDPALGLSQLRARGALAELRADDLAFTVEEAHELVVGRGGVDLDASEVEMLHQRTQGWPAALFLATYWLHRVDDPHTAAREFGGSHRFVADYLTREVIGSLDDDTRGLLLRACVLGRFTAELCDAVLDRSDSRELLEELEHSNLFVVRLEHGDWYRVHPLFAEFGRFQLDSSDPGAEPEIHSRAAAWLRTRDLPVEATEHASAAGDHQLLADLLVEHHLEMIRHGHARTLLRWVQTLSDEQIVEHPLLAVAAATAAAMIGGRTIERRRVMALAQRAARTRPSLFTPYVRAVLSMVRAATIDGNVGLAVVEGRVAVAIARTDADEVLVAALGGLASALYFAGDLDAAWIAALRAVEHPNADRRPPGHAFARSTLALVAAENGWLESARIHAEKAKAILGGVASSRSWLGANACAALGNALLRDGNLQEAEREFALAERFFRDEVSTLHHAWAHVLLAQVRCRRGRLDEAESSLRSARESMAEFTDSGQVSKLADEVERELARARVRAGHGEVLEAPSEAELAVLRLLDSDLSTRQIGEELFLSPNTVRSHTRSIYRKLGVNSRSDAVARAETMSLLRPAQSPM